MSHPTSRRQALKTLAVTGVGAALAATLPPTPAHARSRKTPGFSSRRDLANSFWVGPHLFSFLAEAANTGGRYTLVEATSPPGAVVAPHTHTLEDETLFVLEGELTITLNGNVTRAGPGEHRYMPRGGVHTFEVTSPTPTRALIMFSPGGLEGAYRQVAKPAPTLELPPAPPAPTPEQQRRVAEIFAGYGYHFVSTAAYESES